MAAELTVPRILEALAPEGFRAAHDVRTAYGTLDHVVAGPNGVFAIETKNVRGVLSVRDGHLTLNGNSAAAFVTQAAKEASEIGRRLHRAGMGRLVPALVVSTTARVRRGPLRFGNVQVIELPDLPAALRKRKGPRLSDREVGRALAAVVRGNEPLAVPQVLED